MGLKLCDITMFYPAHHPGGVKSYILAKNHYCLEHTPHAHATIFPGDKDSRTQLSERSTLYQIKSPALPWNPSYRMLISYSRVKQALQNFNPDIVEVGCPYMVPWLVRSIYRGRKLGERPLLFGFYHADFQWDLFRLFSPHAKRLGELSRKAAQRYAKVLYNQLDLCLVSSPRMKERLHEMGIERVEAVPFGVDVDLFSPVTAPSNHDAALRLLYVGRLSTDKGILLLIELMHRLAKRRPKVHLTVVGSGFLEKRARRIADGAPYITFVPFIHAKEDLAQIYAAHDLLVVPNPNETFCISALESMACGTPVACLNGYGGIEAIVTPETGFTLGKEVESLLPFLTQIDRRKLLSMRPAARRYVCDNFSHLYRLQQLFALYEERTAHWRQKYVEPTAHSLHS